MSEETYQPKAVLVTAGGTVLEVSHSYLQPELDSDQNHTGRFIVNGKIYRMYRSYDAKYSTLVLVEGRND